MTDQDLPRRRWGAVFLVLAALTAVGAVAFAATRIWAPGQAGRSAGAAPAMSDTASVPPASPSGEASDPEPSASPSGTAEPSAGASGSRCRSDQVRLRVAPAPGGNAAGQIYRWLLFTNGSDRPCTLYGYPGVSFVTGPAGARINDPAVRTGGTRAVVTLAPTQTAHAVLHWSQPGNFGDDCRPTEAAGLQVYLPDETTAMFVSDPEQTCAAAGIDVPEIGPVEPGAAE